MPSKGAGCKCCCTPCEYDLRCHGADVYPFQQDLPGNPGGQPAEGCCKCIPRAICVEVEVTSYGGSDENCPDGRYAVEIEWDCVLGFYGGSIQIGDVTLGLTGQFIRTHGDPATPEENFCQFELAASCDDEGQTFIVGGCLKDRTGRYLCQEQQDDPYAPVPTCREFSFISGEVHLSLCSPYCSATAHVTVSPARRTVNPLSKGCDGCTNCKCFCECLCITYSDSGTGCSETKEVCFDDAGLNPGWRTTFFEDSDDPYCDPVEVLIRLENDCLTGQCQIRLVTDPCELDFDPYSCDAPNEPGVCDPYDERYDPEACDPYACEEDPCNEGRCEPLNDAVVLDECPEINATWQAEKPDGSVVTVSVACRKCGECAVAGSPCCPDIPIPETLVATFENVNRCAGFTGQQITLVFVGGGPGTESPLTYEGSGSFCGADWDVEFTCDEGPASLWRLVLTETTATNCPEPVTLQAGGTCSPFSFEFISDGFVAECFECCNGFSSSPSRFKVTVTE